MMQYATLDTLVRIRAERTLGNDRYHGVISVDGRTHEWLATLPGFRLHANTYVRSVATPCADVVIMDKKHERVRPETEQELVAMLMNHYQTLHDTTACVPRSCAGGAR